MAIVAQGIGWWIESFDVARASIASNGERTTNHTLERAGVFIGGCATEDHDIDSNLVIGLDLALRNTDTTQLVIGQNLTEIQSVFFNDGGAAKIVGEHVLVFLRSP